MTFTAGQKLRASQMPGYVCTSSTRPSGHSGQIIYETDTDRLVMYTGSSWRYITPEATASSIQTDSGTVTSTSYTGTRTGTSNVAGVAFKAPASGSVRIDWACGVSNSSASNITLASIEVRTGTSVGSGTSVLAAGDAYALQINTATETKISDFYVVSGLTARSDYNVRLMYRVTAGTGTFNRPKVLVQSNA